MAEESLEPSLKQGGRRGRFVVLVGPDGVGKTTAARHLVRVSRGPTAYFHFRPPLRSPMAASPPEAMDPPQDKGAAGGSTVLGWMRLSLNLLRFWLGYLLKVRPALTRGMLVIGDRWAYGYVVQPRALKFYGPHWLARQMLSLFPCPDLVVNLTAPAELIHARKSELSIGQIRDELEAWAGLDGVPLQTIDTSMDPELVAAMILRTIEG